jgi:polyhydroxyalkanoate synthesis regulator phasin
MATATPSPTTARAPKRTTEEIITDQITKLLDRMETKLGKMRSELHDATRTVDMLESDIPALEKKIAAQRAALGIDAEKEGGK